MMARFSAKDARALMARTGVRTVGNRVCVVCGAPLPERRQKYCSKACSNKRHNKKAYKGKPRDVAGHKVSKCRYCGLRADSSEHKRRCTDAWQVHWFWCSCTPTERQLRDVADMEEANGKI